MHLVDKMKSEMSRKTIVSQVFLFLMYSSLLASQIECRKTCNSVDCFLIFQRDV